MEPLAVQVGVASNTAPKNRPGISGVNVYVTSTSCNMKLVVENSGSCGAVPADVPLVSVADAKVLQLAKLTPPVAVTPSD